MGYTHYWVIPKDIKEDHWNEFCQVCQVLIDNAPSYSKSSGGYYTHIPLYLHGILQPTPIINQEEIMFNGGDVPSGERKKNTCLNNCGEIVEYYGPRQSEDKTQYIADCYGHETFAITKRVEKGSDGFSFCKTARKPYDLIVQACLIAAVALLPELSYVASDGDRSDWEAAFEYVRKYFLDIALKTLLSDKFQV